MNSWLVDEWKNCWKWFSTWLTVISAAMPILYEHLSDVQDLLTPTQFHHFEAVCVVFIFIGRIKKQTLKGSES